MKKIFFILLLLTLISTKAYATDYLNEAVKAYHSCQNTGARCEDMKKYTESGIRAYSSTKNTSITDLKSYCSLIYLRTVNHAWGNQEQWMKDVMELNGSCQIIGAFGL